VLQSKRLGISRLVLDDQVGILGLCVGFASLWWRPEVCSDASDEDAGDSAWGNELGVGAI